MAGQTSCVSWKRMEWADSIPIKIVRDGLFPLPKQGRASKSGWPVDPEIPDCGLSIPISRAETDPVTSADKISMHFVTVCANSLPRNAIPITGLLMLWVLGSLRVY